jgi:hypothetical protein
MSDTLNDIERAVDDALHLDLLDGEYPVAWVLVVATVDPEGERTVVYTPGHQIEATTIGLFAQGQIRTVMGAEED